MKISVWNKKGSAGKTPLAISLAIDLNLHYYTNENSTGLLYCQGTLLYSDEKSLSNIKQKLTSEVVFAKIDDELEVDENCIFDFGGYHDKEISPLLSISDYVLIPTFNDLDSSLKAIETIKYVEQIGNKNIIIIATKTENTDDFDEICQLKEYFDYPIINLKFSKIFRNVKNKGMSVTQLYNESPLSKSAYKDVYKQYQEILKLIKE